MSAEGKSFFGNLFAGLFFVVILCLSILLVDYVFFEGSLINSGDRSKMRLLKTQLKDEKKQTARLMEELRLMGDQFQETQKSLRAFEKSHKTKEDVMQIYAKLTRALNEINRLEEELDTPQYRFYKNLQKVIGDRYANLKKVEGKYIFKDEIFFRSASALLTDDAKAQLDSMAETIREIDEAMPEEVPWIIKVLGHADRQKLKRKRPFSSNWILSSSRAVAVVQYLIEKGVDPAHLYAAGFSSYRQASQAADKDALRKSRRAVLSFDRRVGDS